MIRHILRVVWNRKRSNALVLVEIFFSFLVIFVIAALGTFNWQNARQPLGYDITDVWRVSVTANERFETDDAKAERAEREKAMLRELQSLDGVQNAAVVHYTPYTGWTEITSWDVGDKKMRSEVISLSDDALEVMGLDLVAGRWFEEADQHLGWRPVLINQKLAEEAFGGADPIGEVLIENEEDGERVRPLTKVIGVVSDYRKAGMYSEVRNVFIQRFEVGGEHEVYFLGVRVKPGTPAQYEEEVMARLEAVAPTYTFRISGMEDERYTYRRAHVMQLLMAATVAGFLVLMVALGLLGVLWQNVTQRTQELGLRRAKGADARRIYVQILGELATVTLIALGLGVLVILQVPLTGWLHELTVLSVSLPALALAATFMIAMTLISGLYPGWLATRVNPAEALHYE